MTNSQPTPGPAVGTDPAHPAIPPAEHDGVRDVIIIGSGPAGYTAASTPRAPTCTRWCSRASQYGGALMTTTEVENFPGFPDGIMGPELMDDMRKQAERFGAELVSRRRHRGRPDRPVKIVTVGDEVHRAARGHPGHRLGVPLPRAWTRAAAARPRRLLLRHL